MLRRPKLPSKSSDIQQEESSLSEDATTPEIVYKTRPSWTDSSSTATSNSINHINKRHSSNRIKKSQWNIFIGRLWLRARSLPPAVQIGSLLVMSMICGLLSIQFGNTNDNTNATPYNSGGSRRIRPRNNSRFDDYQYENQVRFPTMVEIRTGENGEIDFGACRRLAVNSNYRYPKRRGIKYADEYYDAGPYKDRSPLVPKHATCELMGDWQDTHHPSCLQFHEIQLNQFFVETNVGPYQVERDYSQENLRFLDNGAYRDVWMFRHNDGTRMALKTLRWSKKRLYDPRNYERHRKDAVAMEQLTASPYIVDIKGFCGNSALFDLSTGGDLYDLVEEGPAKDEMMRVAHRITSALADAHHYNAQGHATIAHTDIKPDQFIMVDGDFKLNDFNRARFLTWNPKKHEHCGFKVQKNGGQWRAPEEFRYDFETEKVDVYSLGNVLHFLLTGITTFHPYEKNAVDYVLKGERPPIHELVVNSKDPYNIAMVKAIRMCWEEDPKKRASAKEVAAVLKDGLDKIIAEGR